MSNIRNKTFDEIYKTVSKIPQGKVATYGEIAKQLKISPRMVGRALHLNPDPASIPCHRVVDSNGRVAKNYAFGGWRRQRELLIKEGVKFKDSMHIV